MGVEELFFDTFWFREEEVVSFIMGAHCYSPKPSISPSWGIKNGLLSVSVLQLPEKSYQIDGD